MPKTNQSLAVGNRNAGTYAFAPRALEPDLVAWRIDLDVLPFEGRQNPFNDPAMSIVIRYEFSWDGGANYISDVTATKFGKADGIWNPLNPTEQPWFRVTIPEWNGVKPNFYRASATLSHRTTVGATLTEI